MLQQNWGAAQILGFPPRPLAPCPLVTAPFIASAFEGKLRQLPSLLQFEGAASVTLKAFRAGKATELAAAGKSVGHILRAGEWRSAAFLAYLDEDAVDEAQLLDSMLQQSEED